MQQPPSIRKCDTVRIVTSTLSSYASEFVHQVHGRKRVLDFSFQKLVLAGKRISRTKNPSSHVCIFNTTNTSFTRNWHPADDRKEKSPGGGTFQSLVQNLAELRIYCPVCGRRRVSTKHLRTCVSGSSLTNTQILETYILHLLYRECYIQHLVKAGIVHQVCSWTSKKPNGPSVIGKVPACFTHVSPWVYGLGLTYLWRKSPQSTPTSGSAKHHISTVDEKWPCNEFCLFSTVYWCIEYILDRFDQPTPHDIWNGTSGLH